MEFCQNCGKPLKIENEKAGCDCEFSKEMNSLFLNEKIVKKIKKGEGVFDEKEFRSEKGFPHQCKKCWHEFAEVVDLGAFYSDESNVHLFKCKKCGNIERESYGSSN